MSVRKIKIIMIICLAFLLGGCYTTRQFTGDGKEIVSSGGEQSSFDPAEWEIVKAKLKDGGVIAFKSRPVKNDSLLILPSQQEILYEPFGILRGAVRTFPEKNPATGNLSAVLKNGMIAVFPEGVGFDKDSNLTAEKGILKRMNPIPLTSVASITYEQYDAFSTVALIVGVPLAVGVLAGVLIIANGDGYAPTRIP